MKTAVSVADSQPATPRVTRKPSVALVSPGFSLGGGVPSVAIFLYDVLLRSRRYTPTLVSLATASDDPNSVRLSSIRSWRKGIQITRHECHGLPYLHVGAFLSELEFQRYSSRRILTDLLNKFDAVQIIAGIPAWAQVASHVSPPVLLQVATLAGVERRSRIHESNALRGLWLRTMTQITSFVDARATRLCNHVFTENQWMYKDLCNQLGPDRVIFAPPGVDTKVFSPGSHTESQRYILSVGRFGDRRKNVSMLFRAYAHLREIMPDAPTLVLAGESAPSAKDWKLAEELGVLSEIHFRERVSKTELAGLYKGASLFLLSSDEEGLGIVILEAMSSGVPVVATRCGGPETSVVDAQTGYLVPVGDWKSLATSARKILEDKTLANGMGQRARKAIEAHFSIESAGQVFLETYDSLFFSDTHVRH